MDRKQPAPKDQSNREDHGTPARPLRPRSSGEGSASALDNLRRLERDRARSRPADEAATAPHRRQQ